MKNQALLYKTVRRVGSAICWAMLMACSSVVQAASGSYATLHGFVPVDVAVTPENSVLYDIGENITLRVPKLLFDDSLIPRDPTRVIKTDRLSVTFMYPEMVLGNYPSVMTSIFEKKEGQRVPKPDSFPVYIKWIFYSTENLTGTLAEQNASRGLDWRPLTLIRAFDGTLRNTAKRLNISGAKISLVRSNYAGLRELKVPILDKEYAERSEKEDRAHGWNGEKGAYYVDDIGSPYELFMDCQAPSSTKCTAYVFIRRNHFQYAMFFPPNQLDHADQLIRKVNNMIDGWIPPKLPEPRSKSRTAKK